MYPIVKAAGWRPLACLRCRHVSPAGGTTPPTTLFSRGRRRPFHASCSSSSPEEQQQQQPPPPEKSSSDDNNTPTSSSSFAPRPVLDIKHIRTHPALYEQTCRERNYAALAPVPARIVALQAQWHEAQKRGRDVAARAKEAQRAIADMMNKRRDDNDNNADKDKKEDAEKTTTPTPDPTTTKDEYLERARELKESLVVLEKEQAALADEMHALALSLPNLTSDVTPRGREPTVLRYINDEHHPDDNDKGGRRGVVGRSHVDIGVELGILDFAGAARASGWGWYYLLNEGAQLEQALVAYALAAAAARGWGLVSPPSVVYAHVVAACGFQPRENGATQVYTLRQDPQDRRRGRPEHALAGTAEVPLAAMKAHGTYDVGVGGDSAAAAVKHVAVSRCYRAEAGARGADTRGLYRVHEFTKVELFAWTPPGPAPVTAVFDEVVALQADILRALGLPCRVLEMPSADLGASAHRKVDIEAWFPSRARRRHHVPTTVEEASSDDTTTETDAEKEQEEQHDDKGWGEVTSASICTDYQTRRLGTRFRDNANGKKPYYPWTVNGTAVAVPRVLAALLENGWDEADRSVAIPAVLRPWMGGREKIGGGGKVPG